MTGTDREAPSSTRAELGEVVRSVRYRQLLAVRLASQLGDGFIQLALVSVVLFNPAQAVSAPLAAGALSVGVLPFTVIGPFAGVLLDRWPRQQVLVVANAARALLVVLAAGVVATSGSGSALAAWKLALLWVLVLGALSLNRFLLAGLGAALPHTLEPRLLVTANSITPTIGTGAYAVGAGLAAGTVLVLEQLLSGGEAAGRAQAVVVGLGAGLYLLGAALATRLPRHGLGPDERTAASAARLTRAAVAGLAEATRHLWSRAAPRDALGIVAVHRFAFGLTTLATLLLARGPLAGVSDTGLGTLVLVGGAAAAGAVTAAVVTRSAIRLLDRWLGRGGRVAPIDTWLLVALVIATGTQALLLLELTVTTLIVAGFLLGLAGQAIKIVADTRVQLGVEEPQRGRAFALYDVVFNAAFVLAVLTGAWLVPDDGYAPGLFGALAVLYALTMLGFVASARRRAAGTPVQ